MNNLLLLSYKLCIDRLKASSVPNPLEMVEQNTKSAAMTKIEHIAIITAIPAFPRPSSCLSLVVPLFPFELAVPLDVDVPLPLVEPVVGILLLLLGADVGAAAVADGTTT